MRVERSFDFDGSLLDKSLDGYGDFYREQIIQGICELWKINGGESYAVSRLEYDEYKKINILVMCCYEGKNIVKFVRHVEKIADSKGWHVRIHTKNPTLAKFYTKKSGFIFSEYVLMREPNNG